jgi:hypothetical protein
LKKWENVFGVNFALRIIGDDTERLGCVWIERGLRGFGRRHHGSRRGSHCRRRRRRRFLVRDDFGQRFGKNGHFS